MMQTTPATIVFFSANGSGMSNFGQACRQLEDSGQKLIAIGRSAPELTQREALDAFLHRIRSAENLTILVRLHGGKPSCPFFDEMAEAAAGSPIYVDVQNEGDLELIGTYRLDAGIDAYRDITCYMHHDGLNNWFNLLNRLLGLPADPACPQPMQGLYHPRHGVVSSLEEYLRKSGLSVQAMLSGVRPVIGIWFFPVRWFDGDMAHVDALVAEIERQGGIPICCFYKRSAGPGVDAKDTRWIRDNYFCCNDRPLIHVLINLMCFSLGLLLPKDAHLLGELDIPILNAMELYTDYQTWSQTPQGVSPLDVCASFAQPEFDGYLSTVPVATREREETDPVTGAQVVRLKPVPDRIAKVVRMARNWASLRVKPNREKKVAIIFHCYPPRNDAIGTAIGLDTFQSVYALIRCLEDAGYTIGAPFADASALADQMVSGLTCDGRWLLPEAMSRKAVDRILPNSHARWHARLPDGNRTAMEADWGPSPGSLFVHDKKVLINGVINGNIYLGVQPPRGHIEQAEKIHDPNLPPSHHYIYYYQWLREIFKADAIIHVGTHGSLEWLPGKSAGMSRKCYTDIAIGEVPHIYPYIINIPSEGTQTKRRSFSCLIDHMIPVMTNAGLYDSLAELELKIPEYIQAREMNPTALPVIKRQIWEMVEKTNLRRSLKTDKKTALQDFDGFITLLQDYLTELALSAIPRGLHVLGSPPDTDGLVELVTQIVRLPNGEVPSLYEAVARLWGYDFQALQDIPGRPDATGRFTTCSQALSAIHETSLQIVKSCITGDDLAVPHTSTDIDRVKTFVSRSVLPRLYQTTNEMDAIIAALEGRFVAPGGSGNPTRGQVDILPSGRNFYSVDPEKMPTRTAWEVGVAMAEKLIERYRHDTGNPLESMGIVLWGSSEFRNYGEDIAQALYLMGVQPVWNPKNGRVTGLEVIPAAKLSNPRVDVTFRISGFFRDGLPTVVELLDEAVQMVAALKETPETNILLRNVIKEKAQLIRQGLSPEEAFREATLRLFGCAPGTYGAGVSEAIHAKAWESSDDLGDVFVDWGGYAYGKNIYGADKRQTFRKRLATIQVVVKNEDNREHDLFSSDDFNSFFGGFIAAVNKEAGAQPKAFAGDSSNPDRLVYRSLPEEVDHIFRSRLLNPKWIESMLEHGFKGAGDLSRTVDFAFAWDATSQVIDDWMYAALAETYALDPAMQDWFGKVNPYALQNITERLLEAIRRGMWQADAQMVQDLEDLYLAVEGDIEAFND